MADFKSNFTIDGGIIVSRLHIAAAANVQNDATKKDYIERTFVINTMFKNDAKEAKIENAKDVKIKSITGTYEVGVIKEWVHPFVSFLVNDAVKSGITDDLIKSDYLIQQIDQVIGSQNANQDKQNDNQTNGQNNNQNSTVSEEEKITDPPKEGSANQAANTSQQQNQTSDGKEADSSTAVGAEKKENFKKVREKRVEYLKKLFETLQKQYKEIVALAIKDLDTYFSTFMGLKSAGVTSSNMPQTPVYIDYNVKDPSEMSKVVKKTTIDISPTSGTMDPESAYAKPYKQKIDKFLQSKTADVKEYEALEKDVVNVHDMLAFVVQYQAQFAEE